MKNKKILFFGSFILFSLALVAIFSVSYKFANAESCCFTGSSCSQNATASECSRKGELVDCSDSRCTGGSSQQPANTSCSGGTCEFVNPLGFKTVIEFLTKFLASLRGVVAVIAIIFIVLGGIMYMLSAGSEKMITRAKMCWTGAVIGLAIVLAAPSFLKEIMTILGATVATNGEVTESTLTLLQIATNVLNLLLSIFGIIAIISLVVGGGMYLTSYGDEKRIETGKKIATYSIIGIVIALSAVVIINEINRLITGS